MDASDSMNFKISHIAGNALRIDVNNMKRRFYDSCNSILNKFKYVNEDVKLHLVKSFCSPLLTYSIGALSLTNQNFRDLAVCWNDAFRKIFNFKRWDSVKDLQFFFHELPFEQLYDYFRWKFLSATIQSTVLLHDLVSMEHRTVYNFESRYGDVLCINHMKGAIWDHFWSHRPINSLSG